MKTKENRIAFVIPVFNRIKYTRECLEILQQEKTSRFFLKNEVFIIVVDDGSTDGTKELIRKNFPEVIRLQGTGDLWYSGSLNMGIRYSFDKLNCNFIMVWENDIFPVDNYFNNLQEILEKWDQNSLICSKLYYRVQPDKIFGMGGTYDPKTGHKTLIGRTETDSPKYNKTMEVDWFLGQGVLIHKTIIDKVGYFDEKNFPQYHADVDYSLRARYAGYKNIVYPQLKLLNDTSTTGMTHDPQKSIRHFFKTLRDIRSNNNLRKNIIFYRKHTNSVWAYRTLFKIYLVYSLSYFKWMILGYFGIRKKNAELY